jgi:hypothetical protein
MAGSITSTDIDPAIRATWPGVQFAFSQTPDGSLIWQQWTGPQPPPTVAQLQAALDDYRANVAQPAAAQHAADIATVKGVTNNPAFAALVRLLGL